MSTASDEGNTRSRFRVSDLIPTLIGGFAGLCVYGLGLLAGKSWLGRVMSHDINLLTFVAFGIAVALLVSRMVTLRREQRAFDVKVLGDDPESLFLPADALELRKRMRQLSPEVRESTLLRLLESGLQRARANWSAEDVGTAVRTEADLASERLDASYSMIRYLAWAIPSLGFIGTVMGIGDAMGAFGGEGKTPDLSAAAGDLGMAFDTTLVALVLSIIVMYLLHRTQAQEDTFLVDAASWCMRRFVYRMHIAKE